jgi:hypothetical protein
MGESMFYTIHNVVLEHALKLEKEVQNVELFE